MVGESNGREGRKRKRTSFHKYPLIQTRPFHQGSCNHAYITNRKQEFGFLTKDRKKCSGISNINQNKRTSFHKETMQDNDKQIIVEVQIGTK